VGVLMRYGHSSRLRARWANCPRPRRRSKFKTTTPHPTWLETYEVKKKLLQNIAAMQQQRWCVLTAAAPDVLTDLGVNSTIKTKPTIAAIEVIIIIIILWRRCLFFFPAAVLQLSRDLRAKTGWENNNPCRIYKITKTSKSQVPVVCFNPYIKFGITSFKNAKRSIIVSIDNILYILYRLIDYDGALVFLCYIILYCYYLLISRVWYAVVQY